MSNLISKRDIEDFERLEEDWLENQGDYDAYWQKKLDDEKLLFDWMRSRFERSATIFCDTAGIKPLFFSKVVDMMTEAAMTGIFFGELRWNKDVESMMEKALEGLEFPLVGDPETTGEA